MRKRIVLTVMAMVVFCASTSKCQDTLILRTGTDQSSKRSGQIIRWKGNRITLDTGGRTKQFDATSVQQIQTLWPAPMEQARQRMAVRKYAEAIPLMQAAIKLEDRDWVKAIAMAELVQCLDATDRTSEATIEFLKIYSADPDTRFFHLIPLPWTSTHWNRPPDSDTRKWLQSSNSLLRLLGASWQLSDQRRASAVEALESLCHDPDQRIAQLAATQLWRSSLLSVDEQDTERWLRQIQRIDPRLRAGPLVVLAEAQQRIGQSQRAKINYLKIPILYPQKKSLAANALFVCASLMEEEGQGKNAARLWKELARDFPGSQLGEDARQKF